MDKVINTFSHRFVGSGRATLAIRSNGDTLEIGVSFCSAHDQFSKADGRRRAQGRLDAKRGFYVCVKRDATLKLKQQAHALVDDLLTRGSKKEDRSTLWVVGNPTSQDESKRHFVPRWAKGMTDDAAFSVAFNENR